MNAAIVIITTIIVIFIFICIFYINSNCNCCKMQIDKIKNHVISKIMRGSARWALAGKQDNSPLVAVLHANYGCAYLWALKDIFNDYEIKSATGIDVIDFQNRITNIQDFATQRMVKLCPNYASGIEDKILSVIAGES